MWVQAAGGPALVCRPLSAIASHLFTTTHWALGSSHAGADEGAWHDVAQALEVTPEALVRARQVHGAGVHVGRLMPGERPEADILVAAAPTIAIAIQTADCVPLLVADRRTGACAAAHAGWRGLAARVPAETVAAMTRELGSRPADLYAAIGPSIGACCYEVGADVLQRFVDAGAQPEALTAFFLSAPVHSRVNPSLPGLPAVPRPDRWFLDGWRATRDQLEEAGVPLQQVFTADLCTASHPAVFCSYRRDGAPAGRMAGAIRPGRGGP